MATWSAICLIPFELIYHSELNHHSNSKSMVHFTFELIHRVS